MTEENMTTDIEATEATTESAIESVPSTEAAPTSWLQRDNHGQTNADRYLIPFITPLLAVGGIIFFVLNLSRVFLAGGKTMTIIMASIVTIGILVAASALANAPKMRSQSLAVFAGVGLSVVMLAGWVSVGHAAGEKEEAEVACTPTVDSLTVVGTGSNTWQKPVYEAKEGCVQIAMTGAAHTLAFTSANAPKFPLLNGAGSEEQRVFATEFVPGEYEFHCTITGHENMKAKLVVG